MTTHTWKSNATGQLYDPTNYVDGLPFVAGDTLILDGGTGQWTGALDTGSYLFNGDGGTNSLSLTDGTLDGLSIMAESGTGQLTINSSGQFVNDGILEAGTAAAGSVELIANSNGDEAAAVTNNSQITVQNDSLLQINPWHAHDIRECRQRDHRRHQWECLRIQCCHRLCAGRRQQLYQ